MKTKTLFIAFIIINRLEAQVNSLTLSGDLLPIYDVFLTEPTTDNLLLTFSLKNTIPTNLIFASPDGTTGAGAFRSLSIADVPFAVNTSTTQSVGGAKTFTSDLTVSGTGVRFFVPKGTEAAPSISSSLYPTNGWSFKSSQILMSFASNYHFGFDDEGKFGTSNIPSQLLLKLDLNVYHDASLDSGSPQDGGLNVTTYGTDADLKTATFTGRTASGTFASPHATAQNQAMAEFTGKGNCGVGCSGADAKGFEPSNRGVFGVYAALSHTSSSQPAYCAIQTTKIDEVLDHYSFLVDHAGNAGLVYKTSSGPVFHTSTPYGWDTGTGYKNRFFSIESETNTSDAGLLIQNGGSTGGGTAGINLWFDNDADVVYLDNIKSTSSIRFRSNTSAAGSSTINMTINTTGINVGADTSPDNLFTIGNSSEFQVSSNGKVVKYDNTSTVNGGIPSEIHEEHGIGKTAASGTLTLLASAPADGYYRVNWMATITTAGTGSSTLGPFTVTFTNPSDGVNKTWPSANTNNINGTTVNNTTSGIISGCMTVYAKSGTPITCSFNYTSATGMTYDYYVLLEKL